MKITKKIIAISLACVMPSVFAGHLGELSLGYSNVDNAYFGNSLKSDLGSSNLGLKMYLGDNYSVFGEYSKLSKDSDRYELGARYVRSLNERVAITSGVSYMVYEGDFVSSDDKLEYKSIRIGTKLKLNQDVSLEMGIERYDVDYKFSSMADEREIDATYYAQFRYEFNPKMHVSFGYRDVNKEAGFKISWLF